VGINFQKEVKNGEKWRDDKKKSKGGKGEKGLETPKHGKIFGGERIKNANQEGCLFHGGRRKTKRKKVKIPTTEAVVGAGQTNWGKKRKTRWVTAMLCRPGPRKKGSWEGGERGLNLGEKTG